MTRFVGGVEVALPVDRTYVLYTDARLMAAETSTKTYVEFKNIVEDGPGTQAVWTFIHPEMKTEMMETVIELDAPHRIASHLQITRVMPLAHHEVTPGVMPALAYDMRADYSPLYGKLPVEGVMECRFGASDTGTRLTVETEMKFGGLSRLTGWLQSRSKRHPMQANLEAFRDWVQTTAAPQTEHS